MGQPDDARATGAIVRETLLARRDYVGIAYEIEFELNEIVLPYQADCLEERRRLAGEAEGAYRQASETPPGFSPRTARVGLLVVEGEWAEARMLLEAAHWAGGLPGWRLAELRFLGQLERAQGETERAWSLIRETLPNGPATEPGDAFFLNACAFQRLAAALALDAGDRDGARQWLDAHDRWLRWDGAVLGRTEGHLLWGQWHRAGGDTMQASHHAAQALADATKPRQPLALLAAHRLLGELATDAGRFTDAAAHLNAALALATACAAPYERALTLLALASLHGATAPYGHRAEAAATLQTVRAIGTSLGAMLLLDAAETLTVRLASDTTLPPTYPCGLTAREVEVLRLVAAGLTNAQVAERLFLSPRTINGHLTTIYMKLNVSSRSAAIRFALDYDLG